MIFRSMQELPEKETGEQHSKTVLVFDKEDTSFFDLGFYDFETNQWNVFGDMSMKLICWCYAPNPDIFIKNNNLTHELHSGYNETDNILDRITLPEFKQELKPISLELKQEFENMMNMAFINTPIIKSSKNKTKKFEYMMESIDFTGINSYLETLNKFGQLGWELINTVEYSEGYGILKEKYMDIYFKREIV